MKPLETYNNWNKETLGALQALKDCPQSPIHHAEGDVYIHTQMVCAELEKMGFETFNPIMHAAVLHDIAKPLTTKVENGDIVSPGHAKLGEKLVFELLHDYSFKIKDQIAALVRYHGLPVWFNEKQNPEKAVIAASLRNSTNEGIANLAEADFKGRICNDLDEMLFRIELFREASEGLNCYDQPYQFPSDWARMNYFYKEDAYRDADIFEPKGPTLYITVGLPGAGKSSWAKTLPFQTNVIELDQIRKELKIPHSDKNGQGLVIQTAKERLKENLRNGRDVVWSATSTTKMHRGPIVDIGMTYKAKIKMIYFDTPLPLIFERNKTRPENERLPNNAFVSIIRKLEIPDLTECHELEIIKP